MPIKQARRDQKIEEIDITICNILPLLKRENEHVHKDMSEAYPKLDANEVSRGRKLQAIGDYAVVYEMTKISPSGAESDGRDDLSCMTNVNLNEGQYVLKTLQARAILMGEYEQINEWRNIYLETEIRLLSNIRHPNIINLKATSLELNSFLILERLYDSLTEKIYEWREFEHKARAMFRKKKIDKLHEKKMLVAYDVISAISHLHKHNIIHRDIKPDNFAFDSVCSDF
jgi:serine/threonine protein kinase